MLNLKKIIKTDDSKDLYVRIKIIPGSEKNEVIEVMDDGTIKIRIKKPAEKGKANKELIHFLSHELNKQKEKILIISGQSERTKLLKIQC
ncbi:YggU family protein [Candidatus Peregrinibacteria bacterium]|nr:YggU family protein [Candidatus Peregrinibacteria bacterium]